MQRPSTSDYYRDLGVEETATLEEIQTTFRILERKHRTDGTERPLKTQDASAVTDSVLRARKAYEILCQPSERAKYDNHYANVRAAWFRYRKWAEWQKRENRKVVGRDSPPSKKLTSYSRKFMDKMKERRTQRSTVFLVGTPRSGGQEKVSDAAEESGEDHGPQSRSKTSCVTNTWAGYDAIETRSESSNNTVRRPRERYADSHPQQRRLCLKADHHWQGWWPVMEAFVPPTCPRCQLFASSFYCSICNTTLCLTCKLR
ncbi:hypothetical protein LZ31DRAFT_479320 [Colletotrichum somersetense]|nr:hypothetical protein LZ31DRAFT_479320 [Colletotrichum somersetense]